MGVVGLEATAKAIGIALVLSAVTVLVVSVIYDRAWWRRRIAGAWPSVSLPVVANWKRIGWAVMWLVVLGLAVFLYAYLPEMLIPDDSGLTPEQRQRLLSEERRTGAGIAGAIVLLLTFWARWRQADAAMRTAAATEQGQITERFTRAIDQLGATKETKDDVVPNIEVRIGGIYALEQIARDSPEKFHWQIMEVLCAYVRENTPSYPGTRVINGRLELEPLPGQFDDSAQGPDKPREDVQAALSALARIGPAESQAIRLDRRWLKNAAFPKGAKLTRAYFSHANLEGADFSEAILESVWFLEANLKGAGFWNARMDNAKLLNADLTPIRQGLVPRLTNLMGASLRRAELQRAALDEAMLQGADLEGALRSPHDDSIPGWKADAHGVLHRI